MKKKMLALATALLLAVSCFAAFPASAAGTPLTLSIDYSASVNSGDTVTATVYASSSAALQGFDLAFSTDSNIEVVMEAEPYQDEIATDSSYLGIESNIKDGVYHVLYAGFRIVENAIVVDDAQKDGISLSADSANPTALFSFTFKVKAAAGTTIAAPLSFSTTDLAYKDGSTYSLYATTGPSVDAITVNTPAPTVITSGTYLVDETTKLIKGVKPGMTVADLRSGLSGATSATFYSAFGSELASTDAVTTGTLIDLDGDLTKNLDTYAVVIYGDAMCEGTISTSGATFGFTVADEHELDLDGVFYNDPAISSGFIGIFDNNLTVKYRVMDAIYSAIAIWAVIDDTSISTSCATDLFAQADAIELAGSTSEAFDAFYAIYVAQLMPNYVPAE